MQQESLHNVFMCLLQVLAPPLIDNLLYHAFFLYHNNDQGLGSQRDREVGIPDPRVQVLLSREGSEHVPIPASECAVRAQELTQDRSGAFS